MNPNAVDQEEDVRQLPIEARQADESEYMLWEDIKKKYPNRFVLLENPIYNPPKSPDLQKGIFKYKHKWPKRVAAKASELHLPYSTWEYTGDPLVPDDFIFLI
jgi:hypothetical protein